MGAPKIFYEEQLKNVWFFSADASAAFPFQPPDHLEAFTPTGNPAPTAAEEGMDVYGSTEGPAAEEAPPRLGEASPAPGTGASGEEAAPASAHQATAASGQDTKGSEPAGVGPVLGSAPEPQRVEAAGGEGQPLEEVPSARSVASARSTGSARSRQTSVLERAPAWKAAARRRACPWETASPPRGDRAAGGGARPGQGGGRRAGGGARAAAPGRRRQGGPVGSLES